MLVNQLQKLNFALANGASGKVDSMLIFAAMGKASSKRQSREKEGAARDKWNSAEDATRGKLR